MAPRRGVELVVPEPPWRVRSPVGRATTIACAIGRCRRRVARFQNGISLTHAQGVSHEDISKRTDRALAYGRLHQQQQPAAARENDRRRASEWNDSRVPGRQSTSLQLRQVDDWGRDAPGAQARDARSWGASLRRSTARWAKCAAFLTRRCAIRPFPYMRLSLMLSAWNRS
jgi:hypothetical protein